MSCKVSFDLKQWKRATNELSHFRSNDESGLINISDQAYLSLVIYILMENNNYYFDWNSGVIFFFHNFQGHRKFAKYIH